MAQNLTTNIVINAKTGNGFSEVGNTLTELGTIINGVSQELINFGRESTEVYREYEKSMKDAEVALSTTYGRGTQQLGRVMEDLDAAATEWAATTIFHTNDVANAISEAAHAGWDFDQIMTGIPAAMRLAQAGSIDLSEAVNFIVKATNAAGVEFGDLQNFTDLWTFAANSSASTVEEFGAAMLRMGSTMKFAGSTEELMTLIAVTANAGSVGSEAGTMIRNTMMRLVSPTKKASEVMDEMGATAEEVAEIMNDTALAETNAELAAHGFSVYDESGKLRGSLDIFTDLAATLADIAGGYENIGTNETTLKMLGSIFPTRTITEALNLINAAANGWDGLYEAMMNGEAVGYGEYAAATMMDTLYGKTETFESKVERLKQLVGEELAPTLEHAMEFAGGLVDRLAEMDPTAFSALVDGLGVVAVAGPGLLLAGGALRIIGMLANPIGLTATALLLLAAGGVAAHNAINGFLNEDFASQFGNMTIDSGPLLADLQTISDGFYSAYEATYQFREGLDQAVSAYESAASGLTSSLLSQMVTGMTLTDADITRLNGLGDQMYEALTKAITSGYQEETSYWTTFFGGEEEAANSPLFQQLVDSATENYGESIATAEALSQQLRDAMTSAFEDGEITAEEYEKIQSVIRSYNEAIARAEAEAANEEAYINRQMMLRKGQTADVGQLIDISQQFSEQRDAELARREDEFYRNYYRQQNRGADQATLDQLEAEFRTQQATTAATYNQDLLNLWSQSIKDSDLGEAFEGLSGIVDQFRSGAITGSQASAEAGDRYGRDGGLIEPSTLDNLARSLGTAVEAMGGEEQMLSTIAELYASGNTEMADQMANFLSAAMIANDFRETTRADADRYQTQVTAGLYQQATGTLTSGYDVEQSRLELMRFREANGLGTELEAYLTRLATAPATAQGAEQSGMPAEMLNMWQGIVSSLKEVYDFDAAAERIGQPFVAEGSPARDDIISYQLMEGTLAEEAGNFRIQVQPEVDAGAIETQIPDSVQMPVDPVLTSDPTAQLSGFSATVSVNQDTSALSNVQTQADQYVTTHFEADTAPLEIAVQNLDGTVVQSTVVADATQAQMAIAAIEAHNGEVITITINTVKTGEGFATGGRATTASIFGEAGPEWAIPEQHTERTAELLNAARAASGFSWGELLERFGGLNANPSSAPTTLVYSPTINAQNAEGVAAELEKDKERLIKYLRDKKILDEVEVYA